ncbi:hypothetical protein CryarDRAFT_0082 [Cryptosporangium arvum DSM 44712]|uniref:Uncharacterized protein n=2 Tax=Cryptosporangium TaxID=65502 RepID=A0A010ZK78_9ACTN|nr:hypothetical protein CryarDRAFT_0082 [Cryptosporangium arvum DSM 44712]
MLDRVVAGLLALGTAGGLFAAYHFVAEAVQHHEALRTGRSSVENLDPGTALPTVYVLGGFVLGFAVLFGVVAVLIVRASPLGFPALRGGVTVLLPAMLLAYLATYTRYQQWREAMPPGTQDGRYRVVIVGEVIGGAIGVFGVVLAVLVPLGAVLVRWFRPGEVSGPVPAPGSSAGALNVARILALAGTAVALLVPVAWARPLGRENELPTEWSVIATLSGFLAVLALVAAGLLLLARPGRLMFRWLALGATAVVAAIEWVGIVWQAFYADVAFGTERVEGVAVAWTAAIVSGVVSSGLLTAAVVTLVIPRPPEAVEPADGVTVTRRGDGPAPERIGEATPEPAWQAFPEAPERKAAATPKRKKKKRR